jgi:DNA replication ATP-dependent helicase Dna2
LYRENILDTIDIVGFPFVLSAVDVEIGEDRVYSPRIIVIEPDYLIDVTAVASCFLENGTDSRIQLMRKYMPVTISPPLMTGHIANYFLDELMHNPKVEFKQIIPTVFKLNPIAFTVFNDEQILDILNKSRTHFENLKRTVLKDFPRLSIERTLSFLEPSFYSAVFGIQGRLDVLHKDEKQTAIIELKSGKPYKPNTYGLTRSHYTQTLLYDLLIKSVNDFRTAPVNYILYSGQSEKTIRYAPVIDSLQREAIRVRNELVLIDKKLARTDTGFEKDILQEIHEDNFPDIKGFLYRDIIAFSKAFGNLNALEKKYFRAFSGFIAREHQFSKLGKHGMDRVNGLASMWLDPIEDKEEKFNIFRDLSIAEINTDEEGTILVLEHSEKTNPLGNFRVGDIAVLYPQTGPHPGVLRSQVYKCTICLLKSGKVVVKLRNRQVNHRDLESRSAWNLEHDQLDSGFLHMYRSLYEFCHFPPEKRALFLGLIPPSRATGEEIELPANISGEQKRILTKMIRAKDYFLLWGPPGTGKTSVMLKELVRYYYSQKKGRILLLAYTNRAVDEICEAIDTLIPGIESLYYRIGSSISAKSKFRHRLLDQKIRNIHRRSELLALLRNHQVVVSTVSSILGKRELFSMIEFECVIVDEASQILEPMLNGLLNRFKKWILIGDHKQLPAVVVQETEHSVVKDSDLQDIGLFELRDSYFERMYKRSVSNNWDWAYDRLVVQGRMHKDIMAFPGEIFYEGQLAVIKKHESRDFEIPLSFEYSPGNLLSKTLATQRMIFLPSKPNAINLGQKTNDHEATIVADILEALSDLYTLNRKNWTDQTIGVITPFRAQIANIRETLKQRKIPMDLLTIDTVERYQGGARDIIVLSLSVNHPAQLKSVVSLSSEGIDRKLNVAITRAKEQFILAGNENVINTNALYQKLADRCHRISPTS